jgi:hypothetical protein
VVLFSGKLWLRQLNFSEALQPQLPQVETPFIGIQTGDGSQSGFIPSLFGERA